MSSARLLLAVLALGTLVAVGAACRRENPAPRRTATAAAALQLTAAAQPPTATPAPVVAAAPGGGAPALSGKRAKIAAGSLGIGAAGVSAGIQMWSKAGGVLAGGSTMVGTVQDGADVEVLQEETYLGSKYFHIRGDGKEGWVDGRFVQLP